MSETQFTFQPTFWTTILGLASIVAVVALAWLSWRRSGFRSQVLRLEILRVVMVVACVALLAQPETVERFKPTNKPVVAILVDGSMSMDTRDAQSRQSAGEVVITRRQATEPLLNPDAWESLKDKMDVVLQPFSVGETADATNIAAAIQAARQQHEHLKAIVLASDGDWNDGPPPVQEAMALRLAKTPIFAIPTGSQNRLPDLELVSFDVPTFGVADKSVRLPFSIESSLPRDQVVDLELKVSDGSTVRQTVRVAAMGRTTDAIAWKPPKVGDYTLKLSIPALPNEQIASNNSVEAPIAIREEKLKVLVIESLPRWEYRYLRNALSRDPGVEVSCLLFHPGLSKVGGGNRDYIAAFPEALEELSQYDVVFLGDVGIEEGQLTAEQCRLLKGLVEQQATGLVFMPGLKGYQHSLLESELEPLLPVVYDEAQPTGWGSPAPSHFALTDLGRRSLLTKLADTTDENLQVWESLPGFQWYAPVVRAKVGSEVLAVHQEVSNEFGRIPLLATKTFGNGKILFMGTDGAWRWRRGVEDLYHYRFWGQVVRWMAYQRNMAEGELMRVYYTPEQPLVRQTVSVKANVMERSGEPLAKGTVVARLIAPSGRSKSFTLNSTGDEWGAFEGSVSPDEPGPHELQLSCKENDSSLTAKLFVQGATREVVGKPARPEVLEELARITRGKLLSTAEIDGIVQALASLPEPNEEIRRVQLWSHPLVAAALLAFMTMFWIYRKVIGMI